MSGLLLRPPTTIPLGGRGAAKAARNINEAIRTAVTGLEATDQRALVAAMLALVGTPNKAKLGANAVLAVSMAAARPDRVPCAAAMS